ncbi:MAG: hypothetical protein H6898_11565 [Rhodobacter sp.]|nr:hypothetical protein [Paracoccaceae bacterium]MCC0077205.1 hypothetical protein [Rhodobacter sp.]
MSDHVPTWRIVLAAILDFLTVFVVGGYLIALVTGDTTEGGFSLNGLPAVVLFAMIILYFVLAKRVGGTLWQRILRARR